MSECYINSFYKARREREWRFGVSSWRRAVIVTLMPCIVVVVAAGCDDGPITPGDADADVDADVEESLTCEFIEDPVERPGLPDAPDEVDYLIIAADRLVNAAEDHAEYRDERGHKSEVISMADATLDGEGGVITDRDEFLEHLREVISEYRDDLDRDRTLFVLLLGDGSSSWGGSIYAVPTGAVDGWLWADVPRTVSDNVIADLDGDDEPDIALGRIAAQDSGEASSILRRTRELEEEYEPGEWNYRVHVVASEAGFGDVIDEMIEEAGFAAVREVPTDWWLSLTYARAGSPYAYPPALFSDRVYELLNAGSVMTAYIGHGWEGGFDDVVWEDETEPILDTEDLDQLDMMTRPSLLMLSACLTGAFDGGDSAAEMLMRQQDGATAIVASTEISHPYANAVLIRELAYTVLSDREATVGEAFLEARRRVLSQVDDPTRVELDSFAAIDPSSATPELRDDLLREHNHMYLLFGDPAHTINFPAGTVEIVAESEQIVAGETFRACVQIQGPPQGHAVATLETDRETVGHNLEQWGMTDPDRDDVVIANYELANDKAFERWEGEYEGGGFALALPTSDAHLGTLTVRVYVTGDSGDVDALGSIEIEVVAAGEPGQ